MYAHIHLQSETVTRLLCHHLEKLAAMITFSRTRMSDLFKLNEEQMTLLALRRLQAVEFGLFPRDLS